MRELVGKNRAVTVGGTLRAGGMPTVLGEPPATGELGRLVDMVDWDLLAQGPVPVPKKGEDWF